MNNESLFSNDKVCFLCGNHNVQKHHIYEGRGRRKLADEYGCWVYLCPYHHTGDRGIHFQKNLDLLLKKECQIRCMEKFNLTEEEFIKIFNRSYL